MANVKGTLTYREDGVAIAQWTLTQADTGVGISLAGFPDRTVQIGGTFGGGNIVIEGSNNGTNWATMHNYANASLNITDTSLQLIAENTDQIRPRATAGAGMSVTITVIGVK
jgi:hypothetical protein